MFNNFCTSGRPQELISLHQKLSVILSDKEYLQLINLLEISTREWFNNRENGLRLIAATFGNTELRNYMLEHFVGLSQNYKDIEKTYIRLQIKSLPVVIDDLPRKLQKVTGRNYSSKLHALIQEAESSMTKDGPLTIAAISKAFYPR